MRVRFYETPSGNNPVIEHLRQMPLEERVAAGNMIRTVQDFDLNAFGVDRRKVGKKLWELRASHQRIFYMVLPGPVVWFLHAYDKNSTKMPQGERDLAEKRMREVLARR